MWWQRLLAHKLHDRTSMHQAAAVCRKASRQCCCYQAGVPVRQPALAQPSGLTGVPGVQHKGEIRGQLALHKHRHARRLLGHACNAHNRGENGETRSKDASWPCTSTAMEDRQAQRPVASGVGQ